MTEGTGLPLEPKDLLPQEGEGEPVKEPAAAEGEPKQPEGEDPAARLAAIEAENQSLRSQLSDLVKTFGKKDEPPAYRPEPAKKELPPETLNFLEGVDVNELFDKPDAVLNTLLNKVYNKGREAAMQDLPELVQQHASQTVDYRLKADAFWKDNAELKPYQDFVGLVANQVANEYPTWNIDQVYSETAKRTKERLGPILGKEPTQSTEPSQTPALPNPGGGRKPPQTEPKLDPEKAAMQALWKEFGG